MTEASTWFILQELETRLSDSLYDPEPRFDGVLTPMDSSGKLALYNVLRDFNFDYRKGVEDGVY